MAKKLQEYSPDLGAPKVLAAEFIGTLFLIMTMASAGLPGFANFVSELLVIVGAWNQGMYVPAILATWGIVVTGVYLLRTMKSAFFGKMPPRWEGLEDAKSPFQKMPFLLLATTLLVFGFWPKPLLGLIEQGVAPIVKSLDEARARATPPAVGEALRRPAGEVAK